MPALRHRKVKADPAMKTERKKTLYFILIFQMINDPGYSMKEPGM